MRLSQRGGREGEREKGGIGRGWSMDGQKDGDRLRGERSCWPVLLIDWERDEESLCMLRVIWPGVVKHFSSTCLCPYTVYTAGCSWCSALSQSRTANAACSASQCQTFNTHIRRHTHRNTQLLSPHCHGAYICHYKRTFTARELVCPRKMSN